jgi:hypothetical protein
MTTLIRGLISSLGGNSGRKSSDFSEFFDKSSGHKAKVIREVLREANKEQRKVMQEYKNKKA